MQWHNFFIFCWAAAGLITSSSHAAGDSKKPVATVCSSLTAAGNPEYPPFLWRASDHNDRLLGANQRIINELSRRINIPINLKFVGPWSRSLLEVKNGQVDMIAGAFYTNARAGYMDYFYPVMLHTTSVVWQRKDKTFAFHSRDDLKGKWGATVLSNSFGQDFDQFAQRELNILSVASLSNAFRMLMSDNVDYVLYEKNPGIAYASVLGFEDDLVAIQPSISSESLYLTLSKASPCNTQEVKHKIAVALQNMSEEGLTEKALQDGVRDWRKLQRKNMAYLRKL